MKQRERQTEENSKNQRIRDNVFDDLLRGGLLELGILAVDCQNDNGKSVIERDRKRKQKGRRSGTFLPEHVDRKRNAEDRKIAAVDALDHGARARTVLDKARNQKDQKRDNEDGRAKAVKDQLRIEHGREISGSDLSEKQQRQRDLKDDLGTDVDKAVVDHILPAQKIAEKDEKKQRQNTLETEEKTFHNTLRFESLL